MKRIKKVLYSLTALTILFFAGCKDDPTSPPVNDEHAPPTTITMYLVKLNSDGTESTDTTKVTLRDTSVVKGKPAVEGLLQLVKGKSYKGTFRLWDESKNPAEEMTAEIVNERNSHMFVFTLKDNLDTKLTVTDLSKDDNSKQFGLVFKVSVNNTATGTGKINVALRHYDSGNKSDTMFDTDLDRDFPVTIE